MRYTVCALVLLSACPLLTAGPPSWTIDDVVNVESIADIQVSPDGRWAVWVHNAPDSEKGEQVGNLVRLDLVSGRETVLTRGSDGCSSPRWSPDGKRLAFLRARSGAKGHSEEDAKDQLWMLDPTGGEPWALTEFAGGVLHYDWAGPDAIVCIAEETAKGEDEKDDTIVVEDEKEEKPAPLFRIDVATKKVTRLTENRGRIESVAVAPDGKHAVAIHQRSPHFIFDNKIKPAVMLHDLEGRESRRIFGEPHWNIQHVAWSPDSRGFYAVDAFNSQPQFAQAGVFRLHYYDLARQASMPVDLGWERGLAEQTDNDDQPGLAVTRDGFLALLADGVHNQLARYTRTGDTWRREWVTGVHAGQMFALQADADGKTLLYCHSTAGTPTQWYRAELAGARLREPRPFAVLNERLRHLPRARTEVVRWKGAGGDEVEGILSYPHYHRPNEKCPLVVMIHGGPAGADLDAWDDWWMYPVNLVCQRGAFVLRPNYHGSSNYGLKWLESITRGRYGELEIIDIEKGVDSLIARGLVDPARLAVCGWSNGAVLANLLTVRTTRYKAAVAGAGCVEYVSDWANCEFGDAFDRCYFGASPLENPLYYLVKSPFYRLDRVRTPTLILHGEEDRTVPVSQGWVQYRALQQLGKTDVRFVLFPGEKHVLKKLVHQRRKVKEELAWLDRYLFRASVSDASQKRPSASAKRR
jgi:dipeptidyl aminopeptidase/acylaminoacyl peptidase